MRLLLGVRGERAGRDENAFIRAPRHRAAKIADLRHRDRSLIAFALKQDAKADERIDLQNAMPVNSAVAGLSGHEYLLKARFAQQPLT